MNETDGNEKRAILAIVLSMAVLWLWSSFFAPRPEPGPAPDPKTAEAPVAGPTAATAPIAGPPTAQPTPDAPDAAAPTAVPLPERVLPAQTGEWQAEWTSHGGALRDLTLPDHKGPFTITPIYRWVLARVLGRTKDPWVSYGGGDEDVALLSSTAALGVAGGMEQGFEDGAYEVLSAGEREAVFTRVSPAGLRVTKQYTFGHEPYQGRLKVRFENTTAQPLAGPLWVGFTERMVGKFDRYSNDPRPAAVVGGKLEKDEDLDSLRDGPEVREGAVSWFGLASRYFLTAFIPSDPAWGNLTSASPQAEQGGMFLVASGVTLAPGEAREVSFDLFAGPKGDAALGALGHDLEKSVEWGFFGFFAKILYWLLIAIHRWIGDWGLSIIALTVLVKAVFFPLTQKSFKSQQQMKAVQPLLNALREKYKDDREMQAQEQMRLFKEHGVNPMSGCLPMLIQMPIWFALYSTLLYSVDLYRSEFLIWRDLSAADPFAILPLVVGILMIVQQWMTPMTGMDPTQQKLFKFMPVIFMFIMFSLPSGLCLYITVNSLLSIAQQQLIKRQYPDPPHAASASAAPAPTKEDNKKVRKS